MTTATDPIAPLAQALAQTGAIIARVQPAQATLPTPCRAWDVRALVNHVVQDVQQFTASVSGTPWEKTDADLIGDDWTGAYRAGADALLAAWRREGALEETLHLPFGDRPATWRVGQQVADLAVHGWDIATATGQATDLNPEIGQLSLEWGRENLRPEFRGDEASGRVFGPEAPIAADAPLYDKLAAYFGRIPAERNPPAVVHYLEIVSPDADTLTALYQRLYGLFFGPPDPDLGQARVATSAEGTLVGIRPPLAAHEQPIMRTYIAVDDIHHAVTDAAEQGAAIAYPPTRQGVRGTFAIVIQGGVEHGLWQR